MEHAFKPRGDKTTLEEGVDFTPKFDAKGLIPAIAQDADSGEIVMAAFMNAESLARSISTGEAWYWSRSRGELWHKGASSGSIQTIVEMRTDCDQDTILIKVRTGGNGTNCHRNVFSCFYRRVLPDASDPTASRLESDSEHEGAESED
ncbi:MAG: phosphoribosyl-AMP cyclohydrolase [Rhizobiales bacterium]|nr:phosphoribosyl-AMP cyclohydrolase [Hyphomicrobiales bacterium]